MWLNNKNIFNSSGNSVSYRYGFNGQEKDQELGEGVTTAEFWEYDGKLGRRWNLDPVVKPFESPYACFRNNPIYFEQYKDMEDFSILQNYFIDY